MFKKESFFLSVALLVLCVGQAAASNAGGSLPWDTWVLRLLDTFTGPYALIFSVAILIGVGIAIASGQDFGVWSKTLIVACVGISIVSGARTIYTMFFSGAVVPESVLLLL
ncbi:MAG: TrbC/VirB2 family protein [Devosia sp.]